MSDFLTNLVNKTLDPAPAIRPRLTSLFEPLSSAGTIFALTHPAPERFERSVFRDQDSPTPRFQREADPDHAMAAIPIRPSTSSRLIEESSDRPTTHEAVTVGSGEQREMAPPPRNAKDPEVRNPEKLPEQPATSERIVPPARVSQSNQTRVVVPAIEMATANESSDEHEERAPEKISSETPKQFEIALVRNTFEMRHPSEPKVAEREILTAPPRSSVSNQVHTRDESPLTTRFDQTTPSSSGLLSPHVAVDAIRADERAHPATGSAERQPTDATLRVTKRSLGAADRRQSSADVNNLASPEPTINVTIGRVEVRAELDTTSRRSSKQPERAKLMGLDEYLRERAQGGKR